MRVAAAIPSLSLAAGCAIGLLASDSVNTSVAVGVLLGAFLGALIAVWAVHATALVICVAIGFTAGGAALAADAWRDARRPPLRIAFDALTNAGHLAEGDGVDGEQSLLAHVSGVLREDASIRESSVSIALDIDTLRPIRSREDSRSSTDGVIQVRGRVLLTVSGELAAEHFEDWRAGRRVQLPVALRRPSRYLNPGVPDQERVLARRGIALVGNVKSGALVQVVEPGHALDEASARLRLYVRRAIAESVGPWSARSAGVVTAVIIGDRSGLSDETERQLQEAGTYHVIAISGGNIAILVGLTLVVFRIAGLLGPLAMLTAACGLGAYCYIVGPAGGASVARATLMATLYLSGRALDLSGSPGNTLAVTAAVLLAIDPLAVADPAFLLTLGATTAIIVAVPGVRAWPCSRLVRPVVLLGAASVAAEAALFPIGAFVFSRVTVAGLGLNFLAIPLMAVVQVAGLVTLALASVSAELASLTGWIAHQAATVLVTSADLVRHAPAFAWRVAPPSPWVIAGYYVALVVAWMLWRVWRVCGRVAAAAAVAAGLWIVAEPWAWFTAHGDGRLHVTFLDVGQGDSAFIRLPRGGALLVDAGGLANSSFDIGDRVVAPVLRRTGVRRLDVAAVTHAHPDHAGGLPAVLREFRPHDVWDGVPVPRLDVLTGLRAEAALAGARWTTMQTGARTVVEDVQIVVRHPPPPDWERQEVRNDDSLVIELLYGDVSIVLTGDIGREVEAAMRPLFGPSRLRVLKVPHHGSLTSSSDAFLEHLAPRIAVVSAGRGNQFDHPALEVVRRYEAQGIDLFRTDKDGAVTVATDGRTLEVMTFMGRRVVY